MLPDATVRTHSNPSPVPNPFVDIPRDVARRAAIQQQTAQRDDERLQPQARDQQAVGRRPGTRPGHDRGQRDARGPAPLDQHHRQQHPQQGTDRPDRQIDAAGDDDDANADAEDAVRADQPADVLQVGHAEELRARQRDDRAEHDQQQRDADVFSCHGRLVAPTLRPPPAA